MMVDSKYTERIANLLTKAERTDNQAEADAFIAKAQELMTKHSIDEAMLAGVSGMDADKIEVRIITIHAPYEKAKVMLMGRVARANNCQIVFERIKGARQATVWVTGFKSDIDMVEVLFTSLLMQCTRSMLKAEVSDTVNTKSFRQGFVISYAQRIGERLDEQKRASVKVASDEYNAFGGGSEVGLVLVEKNKMVAAKVKETWPRLRATTISSGDGSGRAAGRSAADRAGLGNKGVGAGGRALGAG